MPGIWSNCYTGYFIWWLFAIVLSQFAHDYFCAFVLYMFWKLNLRLYCTADGKYEFVAAGRC
jgi:hypothetical protein